MSTPYLIRGQGRILGRDHASQGKDCQDGCHVSQFTVSGQEVIVGVVSDGCGSSLYSQVGALLLPRFIVPQIGQFLTEEGFTIPEIPQTLYPRVIEFLDNLVSSFFSSHPQKVVDLVQDFFLATIVGFVISGDSGLIFHAGDGLIMINDTITRIDHKNRNPYIGYHLIPPEIRQPNTRLNWNFSVVPIKVATTTRLAIATDGFPEILLQRMWSEAARVPQGVQLWMNRINGPRNTDRSALFQDDASVVAVERR